MNRGRASFAGCVALAAAPAVLHFPAQAASGQSVKKSKPPPSVRGEVVVRFRSDLPECAHCLFSEGRSFSGATGSRVLDQLALRYGIRRIDPLFGGLHQTERHRRALERLGGSAAGDPDPSAAQELGQTYVVKADPGTEPEVLAQELRRDPNILWAEPNYIYESTGTAGSFARREEDSALESSAFGSAAHLAALGAAYGNASRRWCSAAIPS